MHALTYRINAYFAVLTITIVGAGASLIIIHVANAQAQAALLVNGNEAYYYAALHRSASKVTK